MLDLGDLNTPVALLDLSDAFAHVIERDVIAEARRGVLGRCRRGRALGAWINVLAVLEAPHSARASAASEQIGRGLAAHNARRDCIGVRLVSVAAIAAGVALNRVSVLCGMRGLVSRDEQARALAREPDVATKRKALRAELR